MNRTTNAETYFGIKIVGSDEFKQKTKKALDLLESTDYLFVVQCHVKRIVSAQRSGAWAWLKEPTFEVGAPTWQAPLHWYASTIVHEAIHCKLYRENKRTVLFFDLTDANSWTGTQAEITCKYAQLNAAKQMGAPSEMIEYLLHKIDQPTDHLIPYHLRDW